MQKPDIMRLRHMLEAAREAISFLHGRSRKDLERNRMLALALVRCIEVIGEAATRVSAETKVRYTTIPWPDITGMRNWLIHAYFDVNLDRIWDTVTDDLPPVIAELETILRADAGS